MQKDTLMIVCSLASTTTRFSSSIKTFMLSHLELIHNGCESGTSGFGGLTIFQPALSNMSIWWQGRSGLLNTRPGPMILNVASMCIGFRSWKDRVWTL